MGWRNETVNACCGPKGIKDLYVSQADVGEGNLTKNLLAQFYVDTIKTVVVLSMFENALLIDRARARYLIGCLTTRLASRLYFDMIIGTDTEHTAKPAGPNTDQQRHAHHQR